MRMWTLVARGLSLRCPSCGKSKLFAGPFRMRPHCEQCGLIYQKEAGYFLGSIYVNYGLTTLLVIIGFFVPAIGFGVSPQVLVWPLAAFCVLFPLWSFRYARSLWLAFDEYFDPYNPTGEEKAADWCRIDWRQLVCSSANANHEDFMATLAWPCSSPSVG